MKLIEVNGVGEKTLEKLIEHKIMSIDDMLFHFPKKYEINYLNNINDKQINKAMIIKVKVISEPKIYFIRRRLTKMTFNVEINTEKFSVSIFNRDYLRNIIKAGNQLVVFGKFLKNYYSFTASNIKLLSSFNEGIYPLYGMKDITDYRLMKIIQNVLNTNYELQERLPEFIISKHRFQNINTIIKKIHFPKNIEEVNTAKKRLKYEELLLFSLRIQLIKKINSRIIASKKKYDIEKVKNLIGSIPFELTSDQKKATNDIFRDLKSEKRMNRLLQGDVGSGKTIVSLISAYAVVTSGYQVAVLAPTLVLAQQHFDTFFKFLNPFKVPIALLTSEISSKDKNTILHKIQANKVSIVIGTHSLLQENISFHNLGFVIIDEQQRFGVSQRKALREKGVNPDLLLMTATPIPRTLAISYYESHDISLIHEKPKNRKKITSKLISYDDIKDAYDVIDQELSKNRQVYIICPLIQNSDSSSSLSVEEAYEIISKRFKTAKTDILHGKLSDKEKTDVLQSFYSNKTKILVSTTVVEVGVNVANASSMIIFNADSFGLAQLHQLRGRIGRNDYDSYCFFVVDDLSESNDRLSILENTDDGFLISEFDLSKRGPGEVFGFTQSGLPDLVFSNIIEDKDILDITFKDADKIITSNDRVSKNLVSQVLKSIDSYNFD